MNRDQMVLTGRIAVVMVALVGAGLAWTNDDGETHLSASGTERTVDDQGHENDSTGADGTSGQEAAGDDPLRSSLEIQQPAPLSSESSIEDGPTTAVTDPSTSADADTTASSAADDGTTASTSSADSPTTQTTRVETPGTPTVAAVASDPDSSTTATTARRRTSTDRPTATTARPTTVTTQRTTTTRPTTTTTEATTTTTRPTTTTTRATTTTTQATTTTTRATTTTTQATTTTTAGGSCPSGFERVFRDDFNGSSLNGTWTVFNNQRGNNGFGRRERSAISVENGRFVITAQMVNGTLTSSGISHPLYQTYGKYVFRIRTDNDPSLALSGVGLTWPQSGSNYNDGENNIYETLANAAGRNPFYSFIHKPGSPATQQKRFVHNADGAQWQTMTMEWTPDRISVTREGPGGSQWSETQTLYEDGANRIPDNPHRFGLQLDAWEHSMTGQVKMEVDWVEIHSYCGG